MGAATVGTPLFNASPANYVGTSMFIVPISLSSSYSTGGDEADFAPSPLLVSGQPYIVKVDGVKNGYSIQPVYQTSPNEKKVKFRLFDEAGVEYPSGSSAASFSFRVEVVAPVNTV